MIYLNGVEIKPTIFPDKTSQVWKLPDGVIVLDENIVTWKFENEGEFLHLAQLKLLLDQTLDRVVLKLPYLPYGRQDKQITNHSTFALLAFAGLLNSLKFDEVIITDPHNEVTTLAAINDSKASYPIDELSVAIHKTETDTLCYPDLGAASKYSGLYESLINSYVKGSKERDPSTGKILKYNILGMCKNRNILIVDDICDGGATFIIATKELFTAGAKSVNLFVSHGLFTKGTKVLFDAGISRIFTKEGEVIEKT